jgi:arginyl-tRNA synthetase
MYRTIQQSLLARIQAILLAKYDVTLTNLSSSSPQHRSANSPSPVAFELAKRLRKAPAIAPN